MIPVTARLIELHRSHAGSQNVLISEGELAISYIVFKLAPDRISLRQEHRKTLADKVVGHEEAHFLTDLAVVAALRLGELL
jgi:hypothetical protein